MSVDLLADTAERFKRDTKDHEMTVLHEDGLYRHLRFRKPAGGYSEYWFDLVTWPGVLVIRGDMETFAFSRAEDMLAFFRECGRVNPGYWGEKLLAPRSRDVRRYSEDKFRQIITETAAENEAQWPGLGEAVEREFFGVMPTWDTSHEHPAREGLREFGFGDTWSASCACGEKTSGMTEDAAHRWRSGHISDANTAPGRSHRSEVRRVAGFRFTDTWEWDLNDWTYQYLWCCHAIVFGIGLYDAAKAVETKEQADA